MFYMGCIHFDFDLDIIGIRVQSVKGKGLRGTKYFMRTVLTVFSFPTVFTFTVSTTVSGFHVFSKGFHDVVPSSG